MKKVVIGWAGIIAALVLGPIIQLKGQAEAWSQISTSIVLQAVPFLVLGVIISAVIEVFVPQAAFRRLPRNEKAAVPVAAASGFLLPACECASVPVTQSLVHRGVPPAAALAFLLASPAINPVVLVSTAVAFGGDLRMMIARLCASLIAAIIVGWVWISARLDIALDSEHTHCHGHGNAWDRFRESCMHDLLNAGGFLVIGAMLAAVMKVLIPVDVITAVGIRPLIACLIMATLAIVISLCSEADAFVAASLTMMPATAQLVFLVVGPMVDVKLIAMQQGAWGRGFVTRFVPLTLLVAITVAIGVGSISFGDI
ncbi:membrane protein [Corynebacterium diphtheriae]|uniref:permease n=1 Tax=Corynebacterium diphtheriae TaxID=1717 RepID=UPI0013C9844D|nr:permease [Corynebacterium diphtheriae]QOE67268.1 permease [Corynebacterium diphtheriae bv. mitis]CAB0631164.1 membrane protein [Corynebacterium diphtheriae]CAB0735145.1 membrane protein [Corynebacterium diphtheriae]CAB0787419.1 membrane protein [Corynebacterium diphtheriae]CAB0788187.1 membrane protein [Corynebacterium diphtheriae]